MELVDDSVLSELWKQPAPNPLEVFDTVTVRRIADDMLANTPYMLKFRYGYETIVEIAWSEREGRFFTLFSCC